MTTVRVSSGNLLFSIEVGLLVLSKLTVHERCSLALSHCSWVDWHSIQGLYLSLWLAWHSRWHSTLTSATSSYVSLAWCDWHRGADNKVLSPSHCRGSIMAQYTSKSYNHLPYMGDRTLVSAGIKLLQLNCHKISFYRITIGMLSITKALTPWCSNMVQL